MVPRLSEIALAPPRRPDPRENALIAEASRYVRESAEEWYHGVRRKYGHSRMILEPVVLKPVCDECLSRDDLPTSLDRCWTTTRERDVTIVLPEKTRPERFAIYDGGKRLLYYLWRDEPPNWWPGVQCTDCRQTIEEDGSGIFAVYRESFSDYCGLPDAEDAPKSLRGDRKKNVRERLTKIYGGRCFECGKRRKLTLDHIEPRSRGGTWLTTNLQPFCEECQKIKADYPSVKVVVALDMLLRSAALG
jgi:hypothetical protein